jgi:catechol 2,3-dioxygenase-like lactoylglutathione lyase family enzyme
MINDLTPLLNVEDVERSFDFYVRCLGFEVVERWENAGTLIGGAMRCGDVLVLVNRAKESQAATRRGRKSGNDVVLYFGVDDVFTMRARLTARKVPVSDIEQQSYGVDEFHAHDPDGYELSFTSPALTPDDA